MSLKKILTILTTAFISFSVFSTEPVPSGYANIKLGMSLDSTKSELQKNPDFGYHGDRDVSLIPGSNRILIETDATKGLGSNFLNKCWFQFSDDTLYTITININPDKMDYYSIFTTLIEKYGEPSSLNSTSATWKDENYTMSLEKPLTLKYIDNKKFDSLQNYNKVPLSGTETTRQMFLDAL